jgi:hypothetical protein
MCGLYGLDAFNRGGNPIPNMKYLTNWGVVATFLTFLFGIFVQNDGLIS